MYHRGVSFEAALATTTALARTYAGVASNVSAAACAADHDPSWSAADDERLDEAYAKKAALEENLVAAFDALDRDHRTAWRAFLATAATRLGALCRHANNPGIVGTSTVEAWAAWASGARPSYAQELFASGLDRLAEHEKTIDHLMVAGR